MDSEHAAGNALFGTFGNPMTTDPSVMGKDSGVANTNIVWHAGRLMALEEGHTPFELDPETLESARLCRAITGAGSPPIPKLDPGNRRDGLVRLFGRRDAVLERPCPTA